MELNIFPCYGWLMGPASSTAKSPSTGWGQLAKLGLPLLNALLPPLCLQCDTPTATPHGFCAPCWGQLPLIEGACCPQCGLPFATDALAGEKCLPCLEAPPAFAAARAALRYDTIPRQLILALKFADNLALAPGLAGLLQRVAAPMLAGASALVPVPLHYWRLAQRRYNQSMVLATALSHHLVAAGLPCPPVQPELLTRQRATRPQATLPRPERAKNVRGAFAVPPPQQAQLQGKIFVLLDDIMTTGATLDSAAQALLAAGAAEVRCLVLARVTTTD